ncbi:unnamed protein product [Cochlearia groenlandica]
MSEMSICQEAEIVDLDADDNDEVPNQPLVDEEDENDEKNKKRKAVSGVSKKSKKRGTLLDGQPIIELPPKKINLRKVDFSAEERSFYVKLEADSRSQFKAYAAAGTLRQNYANILQMLLCLRQDTPVNPVVTFCGHVFCYQCVSKYITRDGNMCRVRRCREDLARDVVLSESALRNCIKDDLGRSSSRDEGLDTSVLLNSEFVSSKIKAILDILESHSKQGSPNNAQHGQMSSSSESDDDEDVMNVEPMSHYSSSPSQGPIKTIVFSQWIGMLNLVEMCFVENDIDFRRLDGTMSLAERDEVVKEFCNDPDTVTVTRITIKDTIEDRILLLQEDKRKMIASAFGEEHGGSGARLTVADLNYLFKV